MTPDWDALQPVLGDRAEVMHEMLEGIVASLIPGLAGVPGNVLAEMTGETIYNHLVTMPDLTEDERLQCACAAVGYAAVRLAWVGQEGPK